MLKKLAGQIVGRQVRTGSLTKEETEVYTYAYEVLLNQLINIFLSVVIAVCMRDALTVFVFLASYIPLRSYCGGYHAKTHLRCSLLSAGLLVLVCIMMRMPNARMDGVLALSAFLLSGVLIFVYAPVESANKPLDDQERGCYRRRGRLVWLLEALVTVLCWQAGLRVVRAAALTHMTFACMLCTEVVKNRIAVRKR